MNDNNKTKEQRIEELAELRRRNAELIQMPPGEKNELAGTTGPERAERNIALLTFALNKVREAALLIDEKSCIRYVNEETCRILGYTRDELLGLCVPDIDPDFPLERWPGHWTDLKAQHALTFESHHRTKDGHIFPVEVSANYFEYDGQSYNLALVRDISERKQAEEAMKELNARMQALIQAIPDQVYFKDTSGSFQIANKAVEDFTGLSQKDLTGKTVMDLLSPDLAEECKKRDEEVLKNRKTVRSEEPFTRNGVKGYLETTKAPIFDDLGNVVGLVAISRDITESKRVEQALRESEERYHSLFDQSPDGIVLINTKGEIIEFNESTHRELGYTKEEFEQISVSDLDPHESPDDVKTRLTKIMQDGKADFHVKHRTKQGELRDVHVIVQAITLSGAPVFHAIWHDVTEIKSIKDKLEEKTAEQNAILENAHAGISFLKDRRFVWINHKLEEMFGYERNEVIGRTTEIFFPSSEEYEQLGKEAYPLLADGKTYTTERMMKRKDGSVFWCSMSGKAIDAASSEKGSIWILQDITERKKAEEKIRQNEEFIRSILDTVDEGFIVIDRDFHILTANKAYCNQAGKPCGRVIGKHCYEISHKSLKPCYEDGEDCAVRHVFVTGEPHAAVHRHTDAEGSILYVETKAFPITDTSGAVISAIETVSNITEKHLLEEERLKTQKLEAIGTLAGGIAHDFNNLLHGVFGYISMAKAIHNQKERQIAMLEQAEKALNLSVNLTTQLLTFSKGGKPVKKKTKLQPVIENSVKFALSGSNVDFCIDFEDELWSVEADEGQIGQVIQNIVLNADQAMPMGGAISIAMKNVDARAKSVPPSLSSGKYVEITIEDTGVGIPEKYLPKIFDPYFTTKDKGSGLGLATSYSIIKNHGGLIDVKSKSGAGTSFVIYIPAIEAEEAKRELVCARAVTARKAKILVMDDEDLVRRIVGIMAGSLGHEVEFAENGDEAVAKYREALAAGRRFEVVILDLTIRGGKGGKETIKELIALDPEVTAVVSSGYSDDDAVSEHQSYGFKACLAKPYEKEALRDTLNSLLQ